LELGVVDTLVRELGLCLSVPIRVELLLGYWPNLLQRLPGAMFIVEAIPFAEVFDDSTASVFALRYDPLYRLERLELFFLALFLEKEYLFVLARELRRGNTLLVDLVRFNVIVDAL